MPTGSVDLVINLREDRIRVFENPDDAAGVCSNGAVVHGAQSRSFVLDALQRVDFVGVHFRPGGGCLLGLPAQHLADRHVSLVDIWGVRAIRLREQLLECRIPQQLFASLERELLQQMYAARLVRPAISFALRAFAQGGSVQRIGVLHEDSGYSERQFRTLFTQAVGLPPKAFARVQRLTSALHELAQAKESLASIAAASGYYDQAHFAHELRELAGVSPSEYKPMARSPLHMEVQ
jgi:AraC-like DNA-binding protein